MVDIGRGSLVVPQGTVVPPFPLRAAVVQRLAALLSVRTVAPAPLLLRLHLGLRDFDWLSRVASSVLGFAPRLQWLHERPRQQQCPWYVSVLY